MILPSRRWLRFSLRTMFVVITFSCVWLGREANIVRERKAAFVKILAGDDQWYRHTSQETYSPPFWRRWMGDIELGMHKIFYIPQKFAGDDIDKIKRLFPETEFVPNTVIQRLHHYRIEIEHLLGMFAKETLIGNEDEAHAEMRSLQEQLANHVRSMNLPEVRRVMDPYEKACLEPAIREAESELKVKWDSPPDRSWFLQLSAARSAIHYYLQQVHAPSVRLNLRLLTPSRGGVASENPDLVTASTNEALEGVNGYCRQLLDGPRL